MPFLQGSGAISLNDIKTLFGGPVSPSLGNYYRGGTYIPSTKTVPTAVREPASGTTYNPYNTVWYWRNVNSNLRIYWNNVLVYNVTAAQTVSSATVSGITYFRAAAVTATSQVGKDDWTYLYAIHRTYPSSNVVSINTGVPFSGTISLSQFYNAEKP